MSLPTVLSKEVISPAGAVGINLRIWEGSPNNKGILLSHGLASNARLWDGVANRLSEYGYPVVAIDQRGHGLSQKPESGYDFQTIMVDMDAVVNFVRREGTGNWLRPVIAGQSWGANIVFEYGWSRPWNTSGIVCVDGGIIDLSKQFPDWESCAEVLAPPRISGVLPEDLESAFRAAHPDWSDLAIQGTLANFRVTSEGFVEPWLSFGNHMKILRGLYDHRPGDHYETMQTPVMLLPAGNPADPDSGPVRSSAIEEAAARIPKIRVHVFSGADHDLHAQHPVEVADLIHAGIEDGFLA